MLQLSNTVWRRCIQFITIVVISIPSSLAIAAENSALINGFYAEGNCENPKYQFYVINETSFNIFENAVGILTANEIIPKGKYILKRLEFGEKYVSVSYSWLENGNYNYVAKSFDKPTAPDLASLPSDPPNDWEGDTYVPCEGFNPSFGFIHAEGFNFFKFVSEMDVGQCKFDSKECLLKLWGYVDVSGNSMLSKAEISRLIRILAYIGAVQNADISITNDDLFQTVGLVSMIAPFIASSIIDGSDYNNDQQLDLDELFLDRDIGTANQALQKMSFDIAVSTVGGLFKGLPFLGDLIN